MGKVFDFYGAVVKVKDPDHNPPHVHAIRGGCEARYNILTMEWMDSKGFTRSDLRVLEAQIYLYLEDCWNEWRRLHEEE